MVFVLSMPFTSCNKDDDATTETGQPDRKRRVTAQLLQ